MEIHLFQCWNPFSAFHFLLQNPKYVFQNFTPDLQIESTQNLRAAFPIIHKYSQLFWTLLNRNKIIFT